MKRSSFRLRLALLSAALAGGMLVGFALLSGWLIYAAKLDRLDAQMGNALLRLARLQGSRLQPGIEPPPALDRNLEPVLAQELGLVDELDVALRLTDRNGDIRYQSEGRFDRSGWPVVWPAWPQRSRLNLRADAPLARGGTLFRFTRRTATGPWRISGLTTPLGEVAIAVNLRSLHHEMTLISRIYGLTIPGALLLIAGGSWLLSGRALAPINQLRRTIQQVTAQGLDQRVPVAGAATEFAALIGVFNAMLERLERSFQQASRFSGDAAHELKTPLAILQGELEQALQQTPAGSSLQQTLGRLLDEVRRLHSIVQKLLLLSLADAGRMTLQRQEVDLSALLQEQLEDIAWVAAHLTVTSQIAPGLTIWGDRQLLTQLLHNLFSNAVKYNHPQGWINLQAQPQGEQIIVTLANRMQAAPGPDPLAAPETPPPLDERIFERFYRGDAAHNRQVEGLGLGLSLAREIARAHGGDLVLAQATSDQIGLTLSLPAPTPLASGTARPPQKRESGK